MMGVIVDDHRAIDLADAGEAALDALEPLEAAGDRFVGYAELERDSDGGQGILNIVPARVSERGCADRAALTVACRGSRHRSGCRRAPA